MVEKKISHIYWLVRSSKGKQKFCADDDWRQMQRVTREKVEIENEARTSVRSGSSRFLLSRVSIERLKVVPTFRRSMEKKK